MERMSNELTNMEILNEIGIRIKTIRLSENMRQEELAELAGVSSKTIARLENGSSLSLDNFLSIMRVLRILENLEVAIPSREGSPIEALEIEKNKKSKMRASSKKDKEETDWKWGDER